ncbi:uncharacterized protein LOC118094737 isoform X4 [Zootoca vivipara]|nr:uncharacterized protein LOC118094737 isoform X4 [Zootoca vivipara]XP_060137992.1 uncharacterized protein LOC118094737 isoform X4 [Zootoca vivipara]
MRCLAQDLAALTRQHEEAQCQAWALFQEAEGLRRELAEAQGLMQEAQRKREDLEARWVQEKALEAGRMNQANEERDRYQRRVQCLREKLQEAREVAGMIPRPAAAESSPSDNTFSTSCEETSVEGGSSPKVRFLRQPPPCECSLALSEEHLHGRRWACSVVTARLQLHPGSLPGPQGGGGEKSSRDCMSRRACWFCELLRKRELATPHNPGVYKFLGVVWPQPPPRMGSYRKPHMALLLRGGGGVRERLAPQRCSKRGVLAADLRISGRGCYFHRSPLSTVFNAQTT